MRTFFMAAAAAAIAVLASGTTIPAATQAPAAAGQAPGNTALPGFEASVKRSQTNDGMISMRMDSQGRTMTGMPLRQLIVQSYGIQPNQLIGGPDWLASDRWDIQLRADGPVAPPQANLLFQQMLGERFKLVVHRETRELPIYELRLARTDAKLGPEIKPAAVDCSAMGRGRPGGPPASGAGAPVPPPPGAGAPVPAPPLAAGGRGPMLGGGCMLMTMPGNIQVAGQPVTALTNFLSNQVGRPVIDKTGLTGGYDLKLSWTPDGVGRGGGGGGGVPPNLPPGVPAPPPIDPNGPSLFTALQEQLGLKLEAARGPVEVLVIDSVQQPTEN